MVVLIRDWQAGLPETLASEVLSGAGVVIWLNPGAFPTNETAADSFAVQSGLLVDPALAIGPGTGNTVGEDAGVRAINSDSPRCF